MLLRSTLLGGVLSALLLPFSLSAQDIQSPFRYVERTQFVGAFGGTISTSTGELGLGPKNGAFAGVRWGLGLLGPLSVDIDLAFAPLKRTVRDTVYAGADSSSFVSRGEASANLLLGLLDLRLNLTGQRTFHGLQPFLLFGGGVAADVSGANGADGQLPADVQFDFGTSFAGQAGAGVEMFVTRSVGVRLDGRAIFWKVPNPVAFRLKPRADGPLPSEAWEHNIGLSAGLSVHF